MIQIIPTPSSPCIVAKLLAWIESTINSSRCRQCGLSAQWHLLHKHVRRVPNLISKRTLCKPNFHLCPPWCSARLVSRVFKSDNRAPPHATVHPCSIYDLLNDTLYSDTLRKSVQSTAFRASVPHAGKERTSSQSHRQPANIYQLNPASAYPNTASNTTTACKGAIEHPKIAPANMPMLSLPQAFLHPTTQSLLPSLHPPPGLSEGAAPYAP